MPERKVDERRVFAGEFRAEADSGVVEGRVAPFRKWAPINGTYLEQLTESTFADSVTRGAGANIKLILNHDPKVENVVGTPIEWDTRGDGLYGTFRLDLGSELGAESYRRIQDGFLVALSVGFNRGDDDDWDLSGDVPRVTRGPSVLREVSLVGVGAYEDALITKVRTAGVPVVGRPVDPRIAAYRRELGLL